MSLVQNPSACAAPSADAPQPITLVRPARAAEPAADARWSVEAIEALFALPFNDLLEKAAHLPPHSAVMFVSLFRDGIGQSIQMLCFDDTACRH